MDISRSAVAKWETYNGMPDIDNLKILSRLLGVTIDYLVDNGESFDKVMTAFARVNPDEFYAMATENGEVEAKRFYKTAEKKQRIETRIKELDNIIRCLYEDRVCGRISAERYDAMAVCYETEQAELKQELISITEKIEEMDMRELCIQEFIAQAKAYVDMKILTPEQQEIRSSYTLLSNRIAHQHCDNELPRGNRRSSAKRKRSTDCLSKRKAEGKSPSAYTLTLFLR